VRHRFRYDGPEGEPFTVDEGRVAGVLAAEPGRRRNEAALVAHAMAEPLGTPMLRDMAHGARVLLLVDDATRHTRTVPLLDAVAREMSAAGVPDAHVEVLTAQGTHRDLTAAEIERKVGGHRHRWTVHAHHWQDAKALVDLGTAPGGMPILVNRRLPEADVVVGLGHVGVHALMGYSGGAKIAFPGCAGPAADHWTHWTATRYPQERLLGVLPGPVRPHIEAAARKAGLSAVLNVAMDSGGNVQEAAFGDPVAAQRACARAARDYHLAHLDGPADVVVTDSRPADRDYWQSAKGLYCGTIAVREGGIVILATPSPEGVADNHPNLLRLAALTPGEIEERVEAGEPDVIGAAVAHYTARIRERSAVFLVSSGIPPQDARRLGFEPFPTVQAALDEATRRLGRHSTVAVLDGAGGLLPAVEGRNRDLVEAPQGGGGTPLARVHGGEAR